MTDRYMWGSGRVTLRIVSFKGSVQQGFVVCGRLMSDLEGGKRDEVSKLSQA